MENTKLSNDHIGWLLYAKPSVEKKYSFGNEKWDVEIEYTPNSSYQNQKLLYENTDYLILFDGVVFNRTEISTGTSWVSTIISLWEKYREKFPLKLKGSFNGFILDKKNEKLVIFGDHVQSKPLYYSITSEQILISSDISKIYDFRTLHNQDNKLDIDSAIDLLSFGYMQDNHTLCTEVKRLTPGYVGIVDEGLKEIPFFILDNTPNKDLTEQDAIEHMDFLFRRSVEYQYSTGCLEGDLQLTCLSGGLDSRMVSLVAHKLGYEKQLNITFSQSGYLDESIAQNIASDYNHEWLFRSLDSGTYLMDVDEVTEFTGGNVLYYGLAHGHSLLKLLDLSDFGILHSGLLGDVILGTYYGSRDPNSLYTVSSGMFGSLVKVNKERIKEYKNEEVGKFYNRGYNGIVLAGNTLVQQKIETYSPFLDIEFMDFCLSIPLELRWSHKIYKKWILTKYPEFAKYKWEKINGRIDSPSLLINGINRPISTLPGLICEKIKRLLGSNNDILMTKSHMNPIAYQVRNNPKVASFLNDYYNNTLECIQNNSLRATVENLWINGNSIEKIMIISLLSAIKRFKLVS